MRFQIEAHGKFTRERQKRKSLKECGFTKAGPCRWVLAWKGKSSEAARGLWDCESEIEKTEDQEIKNQSFFSCWAVVVLIHRAPRGCVRRKIRK